MNKLRFAVFFGIVIILLLGWSLVFLKDFIAQSQKSASFKLLDRLERYEQVGYYFFKIDNSDYLITLGGIDEVFVSKDKQVWFNYSNGSEDVIEDDSNVQLKLGLGNITFRRIHNSAGYGPQDFWKRDLSIWYRFLPKKQGLIEGDNRDWYVTAFAGANNKEGHIFMYSDCGTQICALDLRPSEDYPVDETLWNFLRTFKFFQADEVNHIWDIFEFRRKDTLSLVQIQEQVREFDTIVKNQEAKGWRYVSGDIKDSCTGVVFEGDVALRGWYVWDYFYSEKEWVFYVIDKDVSKIPLHDVLASYDTIGKESIRKLKVSDVPEDVQEKLKKSSPKNPYEIRVDEYVLYCEGLPIVHFKVSEK